MQEAYSGARAKAALLARVASLRGRVLLVLALAVLLPTAIVGVLATVRARAEVERGALAQVGALGAALDGTLQRARRTVELAAATWAAAPDDPGATQLRERVRRDVPSVATLSILDPRGALRHGDPVPAGVDVSSHGSGDLGAAHHVGGRRVVPLVVQARGRTGELVGVVVASLDLGFVRDAVAAARLGPGARVIVVDGAGVVVAESASLHGVPHEAWDQTPTTLAGRDPAVARALASSAEGTLTAGGWLTAYHRLASDPSRRGARWAVLHQQPTADAYALARATTRDAAIVGALALALALALGAFLATRLTRPLAQLARRADAIADGAADLGPAVTGPGEVGALGQRIDDMARRIAARSELQAALARGDQRASVGVMAAQVAHELANPLTSVLGQAKLLLAGKPADDPDRAALEMIASEAERMQGIVGALLAYARTPPAVHAPAAPACEPAAVVRDVGALLGPQLANAHVALAVDLADTGPVAIDALALQQVLVGLVQRALHATIAPGRIAITSRAAPGNIAVVIAVADDGPGVPDADRARVFDAFSATAPAAVGTAVGLAVSKHLVATAGGSIEVGDHPAGRGTEFRVVLPRAA